MGFAHGWFRMIFGVFILSLILFLIWEKKSPNLGKGDLIGSNPLKELFKLDSMVGYYTHEFRGRNFEFCG